MKITYEACFKHQRIYNPKFMTWGQMLHEFDIHFDVYLINKPCDFCQLQGDSHETRTTLETPLTKHQ